MAEVKVKLSYSACASRNNNEMQRKTISLSPDISHVEDVSMEYACERRLGGSGRYCDILWLLLFLSFRMFS